MENVGWFFLISPLSLSQDVSKVRIGKLSPFTIELLRDIKTFFGVSYKLKPDATNQTTL